MRNEDEVQRAHDLLKALILSEVPNPYPDEDHLAALTPVLDVLCWVLRHDHNQTFAVNLQRVEKALERLGFRMQRAT
jgi:hypothetical protein